MHTTFQIQKTLLFTLLLLFTYSCKENQKSTPIKEKEASSSPIHVTSTQGEEWNVLGVKITGKILSNQTNGEYSVIISETPPNGGPPLHVHENEDELFYILKGNFVFNSGDTKIEAKQGDFVRLPRGIPHNFINTDTTVGITMNTITPGGFENFFREISKYSAINKLTKLEIDSIANTYGVSFIKK